MSDDARKIFMANLLKYMAETHINQADIASALGVSKTAVSDWTHGRKYPRVDAMQKLADLFGVPMSCLTQVDHVATEDETILELKDRLRTDPEYRILFKTAADVSKEDILAAVRILKALKGDQDA